MPIAKPVPTAVRRLEFVRAAWDRLDTGRVVLDPNAGTYAITLRWRPVAESWFLDLRTTAGVPIVLGAPVRDRTDCLLGVSTPGRPRGGIMSYDPKGRGDPVLDSWSSGDVGLYYVPGGLVPTSFAVYTTEVV